MKPQTKVRMKQKKNNLLLKKCRQSFNTNVKKVPFFSSGLPTYTHSRAL